jgi:hypothetical protein
VAQWATREVEPPQPEFTQAKEKWNSVTRKIKNVTYIYKCSNTSKEYFFIYMATWPRF